MLVACRTIHEDSLEQLQAPDLWTHQGVEPTLEQVASTVELLVLAV